MRLLILLLLTGCGTYDPKATSGGATQPDTSTATGVGETPKEQSPTPVVIQNTVYNNQTNTSYAPTWAKQKDARPASPRPFYMDSPWLVVSLGAFYSESLCPLGWDLPDSVLPPEFISYYAAHQAPVLSYWTKIPGTVGHITYKIEMPDKGGVTDIADAPDDSAQVVVCVQK